MKGWIVFFEEKAPAENTLCGGAAAELVCEVLVISVDMENGTKKNRSKFFERFDDGEGFFFDCCVILLSRVEFPCIESDRVVILFDDGAKLEIRCFGFDVKWLVMIRVYDEQCFRLKERFHLLKGFIVEREPRKVFC